MKLFKNLDAEQKEFGCFVLTPLAIFFIAFISSCDNSPAVDCFNEWEPKSLDSCNHTSFIYDDFTIKILDKDSLPYIIDAREFQPRDVYDKDSVPLFVFHEESYYHPISIAQWPILQLGNLLADRTFARA